jgi:DNA gyrase subunit A
LEQLQSQDFVVRRRTRMASDEDVLEFNEEAYIVRENANVVLTRDGWIKRVGRLTSVESTRVRDGDAVVAVVPASTLDNVVFFADDGTAYTMRVNEVPATHGHGEPITKYFKMADQVKVITAITTDPRFTPADNEKTGEPHLLVATSNGYVFRLPLAAYRAESTKAGRRYAKPEGSDKVVMVRLAGDETGVMLASRGGRLIHFPLDDVNVLSGVGKGVIGIKLDDDDACLGGALVTDGRRNPGNRLVVETESGKTQDYTPEGLRSQNRGGQGSKPGSRTNFARVVPSAIELVNWEEVEGKAEKRAGHAERNGDGKGTLFD